MKGLELIRKSKAFIGPGPFPYRNFQTGGEWMGQQLFQKIKMENTCHSPPNYLKAGILKYGISCVCAATGFALSWPLGWIVGPVTISVFYLAEVHLLFLFPLLALGKKHPLLTSFWLTYQIGLLSAFLTVIPIAAYMLLGLLNTKESYRGWYVGCLAIILWYVDLMEPYDDE